MTNGEAKVLETDVVLFPMKFGQNAEETNLTEEIEERIVPEKKPVIIETENRFARLKKSLRKRSASIL